MKIVLSRDEIKQMVKEHFGLTFDDFLLEISNENATKLKHNESVKSEVKEQEPKVEYDITVDANGFVTDMVPKNQESTVPFKDARGRTFNYENKCKICGKTFFTMTAPADVCSGDCLKQSKEQAKKAAKQSKGHKKIVNKHIYQKKCTICGKSFASDGPRAKYCSDACRLAGTTEYKPEKPAKSAAKQRALKLDGLFRCNVPKNPKLDYTPYAEKIEEFLNSKSSSVFIDLEGATAYAMRDRYKVAANMFDLASKIHIVYSKKNNTLKLTRA